MRARSPREMLSSSCPFREGVPPAISEIEDIAHGSDAEFGTSPVTTMAQPAGKESGIILLTRILRFRATCMG